MELFRRQRGEGRGGAVTRPLSRRELEEQKKREEEEAAAHVSLSHISASVP